MPSSPSPSFPHLPPKTLPHFFLKRIRRSLWSSAGILEAHQGREREEEGREGGEEEARKTNAEMALREKIEMQMYDKKCV